MQMLISYDRLPANLFEAKQILSAYLQTPMTIDIECQNSQWLVRLEWPADPSVYIDPHLSSALAWWHKDLQVNQIPYQKKIYRVRQTLVQFSLFHSWSAYLWSLWLKEYFQSTGQYPKEVLVLHIDSHADLLRTNVARNAEQKWLNTITQEPISMAEPASIENAIKSGAIGIGNYATLFFHSGIDVHYRHLCNEHYGLGESDRLQSIYACSQADRFTSELQSLAVWTEPNAIGRSVSNQHSTYLSSTKLDTLLDLDRGMPVVLDLDLDYFNNRYNWDPRWRNQDYPNPDVLTVFDELDALFSQSILVSRRDDIQAVNISLSPAFFPSNYWEVVIPALELQVERLLVAA